MKEHVKKLRTKIGRANFTLNKMKNVLDKKHLKLLVNSYVKSYIEYNCGLLSLCNKSKLKPLEIQFKKTIRILTKAKFREYILLNLRIYTTHWQTDWIPCNKVYALSFMITVQKLLKECGDLTRTLINKIPELKIISTMKELVWLIFITTHYTGFPSFGIILIQTLKQSQIR